MMLSDICLSDVCLTSDVCLSVCLSVCRVHRD